MAYVLFGEQLDAVRNTRLTSCAVCVFSGQPAGRWRGERRRCAVASGRRARGVAGNAALEERLGCALSFRFAQLPLLRKPPALNRRV